MAHAWNWSQDHKSGAPQAHTGAVVVQARQARQHLEAELAVRAPRGELQALQNQNQQLQEEVSNLHAALKAADEKVRKSTLPEAQL